MIDVSDDDGDGLTTVRPQHVMLDHLRRVIRPLELPHDFPFVFNLGESVEVWFRVHRLPVDAQVLVLRSYIWTDDVHGFADMIARPPLELALVDAEYLWGLITTWVASL